jgi:hypothetical protein
MERAFLLRFRNEPWFKDLDQYSKETTPLNQLLGGYLRSTVICLSCKHESVTFQHFQDLPLDISRHNRLNEAIEGYFSRENLEECGYKCESCKKRVSGEIMELNILKLMIIFDTLSCKKILIGTAAGCALHPTETIHCDGRQNFEADCNHRDINVAQLLIENR